MGIVALALNLVITTSGPAEDTDNLHDRHRRLAVIPAGNETNSNFDVLVGNSTSTTNFPKDLFTLQEKKNGAIILHVICIIYMFYGIAIICDNYFEPALEEICEALSLKEDVAGATFMAAGGSAPELATSLLGVFVSKSDVGIGTIVGSAVFNILFVIAVCALAAPNLKLTWWPLARDCTYYCFSIIALVLVIADNKVEAYEAGILLGLYFLYVFIMSKSESLQKWFEAKLGIKPAADDAPSDPPPEARTIMVSSQSSVDVIHAENASTSGTGFTPSRGHKRRVSLQDGEADEIDPDSLRTHKMAREVTSIKATARKSSLLKVGAVGDDVEVICIPVAASQSKIVPVDETTPGGKDEGGGGNDDDDDDDDGPFDPFEVPEAAHWKVWWIMTLPLVLCMYVTIPDCSREERQRVYPVTFLMCILYLGALAYMMVWMANELGQTIGIPEPVMGLTLLAMGTSIPDALSSLAVARKGFGDMAVSSSVGSNIFDLLIGLPVPWLLKTAVVDPGTTVTIYSDNVVAMVVTLFAMVAAVVVTIHLAGWRLTKNLAYIYMTLYVLFVAEALMLEYNMFG